MIQAHFQCNPFSCTTSDLSAKLWSTHGTKDPGQLSNSYYASSGAGSLSCATKVAPTYIIIGSIVGCALLCMIGGKLMNRRNAGEESSKKGGGVLENGEGYQAPTGNYGAITEE